MDSIFFDQTAVHGFVSDVAAKNPEIAKNYGIRIGARKSETPNQSRNT